MPIYEYKCRACGQVSEKWCRIDEAPNTICEQCPKCSQAAVLDKQMSVSSFRLTGEGWYKPTSDLD